MTYSHLDPAMQNRVAWTAGKTVGTKRPLTQKQIWAIRFYLDRKERLRDRALFDLAIDSKLRDCDLVSSLTCRGGHTLLNFFTGVPVQAKLSQALTQCPGSKTPL